VDGVENGREEENVASCCDQAVKEDETSIQLMTSNERMDVMKIEIVVEAKSEN